MFPNKLNYKKIYILDILFNIYKNVKILEKLEVHMYLTSLILVEKN